MIPLSVARVFVEPHVFVEPYTPPVPQAFYLTGAAVAVVASFALVGFFAKNRRDYINYPVIGLLHWHSGDTAVVTRGVLLLQLFSISLFVLVIATCFWGNPDPLHNFAPTFIWIIWWVGVTYISAFVGDIWAVMNPWKIIFSWAETAWRSLGATRSLSLEIKYPEKLGAWPGVALFLCYAWVENVYEGALIPARIGQMLLAYSGITLMGMFVFGKTTWLRHGESFSLAFGFLSRFAPTEIRTSRPLVSRKSGPPADDHGEDTPERMQLNLRPFGAGLLNPQPTSISQTVFILVLLGIVTFDGLTATSVWPNIQEALQKFLPGPIASGTGGLIGAALLSVLCYLTFSALMSVTAGRGIGVLKMATSFAYSLIPIALAYHVAHFLLFLLIQGQWIIPLLSDPFGFNWNLIGTASYRIDFNIVSPTTYWLIAVIGIVAGHIAAVFLAHNTSLRLIQSRRQALRSQYPMLVLMVGYTVVSLWIITQPMYMQGM